MSDPKKAGTPPVGDAVSELVVVAFDLLDAEVDRLPQRALDALKRPEVQRALAAELTKLAKKYGKMNAAGEAIDAGTTADDFAGLGKKVAGNAGDQLVRQIKDSSDFKKLEGKLKQLEQSVKKSPVGVWVDENSTILIVSAVAIGVGGGAWMYHAKAGDMPAKYLADIATTLGNKHVIKLGSLSLGAGDVKFVPSRREVAAAAILRGNYKGVKGTFKLTVGHVHGQSPQIKTSGNVQVPLGAMKVTTAGQFQSSDLWDLSLKVVYKQDKMNFDVNALMQQKDGTLTSGVGGGVSYKSGALSVGARGAYKRVEGPTGTTGAVQITGVLSLDL